MSWGKHTVKAKCENCGEDFDKKNSKHRFCSRTCWKEYCRKNNILKKTHEVVIDKNRKFSDITITLIAAALLKGETIEQYISENHWDFESFMKQMKLNAHVIEIRKSIISCKQNERCKLGY